jgi:hypothetical protein
MSRLDEEKLALLRRWGDGLTVDDREEVRAAGRAILMLSDEIERLHIDLWHARDAGRDETGEPDEPDEPEAVETPPEPIPATSLAATLRSRIAALALHRGPNH